MTAAPLSNVRLFTGNATPELAQRIAKHLGLPISEAQVGHFSDGESRVEILENVRGRQAYVIQSTCSPANDSLMELMLLVDALRRASVSQITAVIPYFGYARQDRRVRSTRVPITAKIVADMLANVGVNRVITADLHADQIQGFFYIPVDNIYASSSLMAELENQPDPHRMIVSPDVGGVVRARAIAKRLGSDLAIIDKRRAQANECEVMHVIGDIKDRNCILVDDIVDTAGTLCNAAQALKDKGARSVTAYCTHPVLSGPAVERIAVSAMDELVVSDTIPLSEAAQACSKIRTVSLSGVIAQTIQRITQKDSVSSLFE